MASKCSCATEIGWSTAARDFEGSLACLEDGVAILTWAGELAYRNPACEALIGAPELIEDSLLRWNLELNRAASAATLDIATAAGRLLRVRKHTTASGGTLLVISDRTEHERELRAARTQLAEVVASNKAFVASLSNRLRSSLNSMLGFAQLAQRDRKDPLSQRHQSRIQQILNEGARLLRVFDSVLELSCIEALSPPSAEPCDLLEIVSGVMTTLEPLAARASVAIGALAAPPSVPRVDAERSRVARILMHYGTNAIQFNRPGGTLTFRITVDGSHVRVTVADTGLGIPEATRGLPFEPFFLAPGRDGRSEGAGLGLAIAKALAESMAAKVGWQSVPSRGSEFWIELPIHDSPTNSGIRPVAFASYLGDGAAP